MLSRRLFLLSSGAAGLTSSLTHAAPRFSSDPFTLGIASGDPSERGMVLWTRLALDPLHEGGMTPEAVPVEWSIAEDEKLSKVVKRGRAVASPQLAHSVHVEVEGLKPGRWYWYQFRAGGWESPLGRTRTVDPNAAQLKYAFASCQNYEQGLFTAFDHLAEEDLELVVHLGDYIYEGPGVDGRVRKHNGNEIKSLSDYRNRYALYRSDAALRKSHERFPWIVTWDDHEVDNNYAADIEERGAPREEFLERRASAYQAYYEHMPLRRTSMARGSSMQLYRRVPYGKLASFHVLDTRQYRTDQPCGDGNKPFCPEALSESGTILGAAQEKWLADGLSRSKATWNILAQQVMVGLVDRQGGPEQRFSMDQWPGYDASRKRLLQMATGRNAVVITGDIHSSWVNDLAADPFDEKSPVVATEFVGTSISSGGDGVDVPPSSANVLTENPRTRFFNAKRGYVRCTVSENRWTSDYRTVEYVAKPGSPVTTKASFVVEKGKPGAEKA